MSGSGQSNTSSATTPGGMAVVDCYVDIYPFEGGSYTLTGGELLRCTVTKHIRQDLGTFTLDLAPARIGPNLSWTQIITPMSFVVIGIRRGNTQSIVMLGVVTRVSEPQQWQSGQPVARTITVEGNDLAYFFAMTDFYTLWYIAAIGAAANGITAFGLLSGGPATIGQTWFDSIMAGQIFKDTKLSYKAAGQSAGTVTFQQAFAKLFEAFPVTVPYGDYFLGANGPWFTKFRKIFPSPFYEFFVTTDSTGIYGAAGGYQFSSRAIGGGLTASPAVIARVNPLPQLVGSVPGGNFSNAAPTFTSIDTTAWDALPAQSLLADGFLASEVSFGDAETANFYGLNATWLNGQYGDSNSNLRTFLFNYAVAIDNASLGRYGYRPMFIDVPWMSDPGGQSAEQNSGDQQKLPELMASLLGRLCGYFEATPLMARAAVTSWLRPDVQIGTKLSYAPFRDGAAWDFYVEGVSHRFAFGGPSVTVLQLARGLPQTVYADHDLLLAVHTGNAQRLSGSYQKGLPDGSAGGLTALTPSEFSTWMLGLDRVYTTAQAVVP